MKARNLIGRLEKLEAGSGEDGEPFYLLWIREGEDRKAALATAKAGGKIPEGVPSYCAEWKQPEKYSRQGRTLERFPRSRLTTCQQTSEDENSVLWEALGNDAEVRLLALGGSDPDPHVRGLLTELTDRDLIGAVICGCEGIGGHG